MADYYDFEKDFLEKFPYRLSRKVQENLPDFKNHEEAREYFKKVYGDKFVLIDSDFIDEKIYFYRLIVHPENYNSFMRNLAKYGTGSDGMEGMMSYHDVEISENGNVHIIY